MNAEKILNDILKSDIRLHSQRVPEDGNDAGGSWNGRLHKHPHREAVLVLEGENDFLLDGQVYRLTPGDAILIDSWTPHLLGYMECDCDLLHLWFFFDGKDARATLCRVVMNGRYELLRSMYLPSCTATLMTSRWNELNRYKIQTQETLSRHLASPMKCLAEDFLFLAYQKDTSPIKDDLAAAVKLYIETRMGCDCSLARLEKIFGYSRYHIEHKFRATYGYSIGTCIDNVRTAFTEDALAKGLKQKEIAEELGFSSAAAFWKWRRRTRTG